MASASAQGEPDVAAGEQQRGSGRRRAAAGQAARTHRSCTCMSQWAQPGTAGVAGTPAAGGDRAQGLSQVSCTLFKAVRNLARKTPIAKLIARCTRRFIKLPTVVITSRYFLSQSFHRVCQTWYHRPFPKHMKTTLKQTIPRRNPNPAYSRY